MSRLIACLLLFVAAAWLQSGLLFIASMIAGVMWDKWFYRY